MKRFPPRGSGAGESAERVGSLIDAVLSAAGVADGVHRARIFDEWPELVGERIAEVTNVRGFSGGTLFVEVRSSAWLMELDLMKPEVLERVNRDRDRARIEKIVFLQAETA